MSEAMATRPGADVWSQTGRIERARQLHAECKAGVRADRGSGTDTRGNRVARKPVSSGALRLTRRGRGVFIVIAVVLIAIGLVLGAQMAFADSPAAPVSVDAVTVGEGQTLWSLAQQRTSPGQDVRDVVIQIKELNGLQGSGLTAGQRLLLPAG